VKRITLLAWLLFGAVMPAQTVDQQIQKDLEGVLDLAAAPREAGEEQRKAKVEAFKAALVRFAANWEPRASELDTGRYALGRALLLLGRPEQAIPHLEQFVRDHPRSDDIEEATLSLGGAYLDARRHDRAAAVYEEFLASRPSSPQRIVARYYLAVTHLEAGRTDVGLGELREIASTGSEHALVADANLKLVQTYAETGRVAEAKAHLAGLLKSHADAPALLALKEQLDWIGKDAPEIEGVRTWINGPGRTFAELRGSVVVVTLFAEPYEASRAELTRLRDLAVTFTGRPVQFIGLTTYYRKKTRSLDDEDRLLAEYLATQGIRFPVGVVSDFTMLHKFGVRGVPHTVVIGPEGTVDHLKVGASRSDKRSGDMFRLAIDRALARVK
jgi:tetratricopeptide (TPR) repeat protein